MYRLTNNYTFSVTPEVLNRLLPMYLQWKKYFDEQNSFLSILVKVLLNADRGIKHVFNLLFQLIDCEDPKFKILKSGAQSLFGKDNFKTFTRVNVNLLFTL